MLIGGDGFDTVDYLLSSSRVRQPCQPTPASSARPGRHFSGIAKVVGSGWERSVCLRITACAALEGSARPICWRAAPGSTCSLAALAATRTNAALGLDILHRRHNRALRPLRPQLECTVPIASRTFSPALTDRARRRIQQHGARQRGWSGHAPPTTYPMASHARRSTIPTIHQLFQVSHAWTFPWSGAHTAGDVQQRCAAQASDSTRASNRFGLR